MAPADGAEQRRRLTFVLVVYFCTTLNQRSTH
jgi:hypothetical protein